MTLKHFRSVLHATSVLVFVAGCSTGPANAPSTAAATAAAPTPASSQSSSLVPIPSAGLFAFDAESVLGYYASIGYTCGEGQPSAQAAGYLFRSCTLVDADGRTRVIGIVTDPADDVADAFASVNGASGESILDPSLVLEPFAAFLGAMLGETVGTSTLPWLAGHLGDAYATESLGNLTIATYSTSPGDHSRLFVEIANQAYIDAPTPAASR